MKDQTGKHLRPALSCLLLFCQLLLFVLISKSFDLAVLYVLFIGGLFLISLLPEYGLALSATANTLVLLLFDNLSLSIPMAVLLVYLFLIFTGIALYIYKNNVRLKPRLYYLQWISFSMAVLLMFGFFRSTDASYAFRKIAFFILFNLLLNITPLLFYKESKRFHHLAISIIVLGTILGGITGWMALDRPVNQRFHAGENINPIWLARSLGISIIFSFYLLLRVKSRFFKAFILLLPALMLFPMIRTWSRAPFIGMAGAIFLMIILQPHFSKLKRAVLALLIVAAGAFLMISTAHQIASRLQMPLAQEWSSAFRIVAWYKAFGDFLKSPLLGIGTGSFLLRLPFLPFKYPHNLILEAACENGIFGLLLILAFLGGSVRLGFKNIHDAKTIPDKQLAIVFLSAFFYASWNAMFSGDITSNETIWLFSGVITALHINFTSNAASLPLKNIS